MLCNQLRTLFYLIAVLSLFLTAASFVNAQGCKPGEKVEYKAQSWPEKWEEGTCVKTLPGGKQVLIAEKPNEYYPEGFQRSYALEDVRPVAKKEDPPAKPNDPPAPNNPADKPAPPAGPAQTDKPAQPPETPPNQTPQPANAQGCTPGDKVEYKAQAWPEKWEVGTCLKVLPGGKQVLIAEKPNDYYPEGFQRSYSLDDVRPVQKKEEPPAKPNDPPQKP